MNNTVKNLKKPKMIVFDYGHTLLYEPGHNPTNGNKELYKYISKNSKEISLEEFNNTILELFDKIKREHGNLVEIHEHQFLRTAMEYMNIELEVTIEEAERIVWTGISAGKKMPYAEELLEYLEEKEIRTGVISNICFSGKALEERLNRLLPNNKLEFVLASSEYVMRKPDKTMFEIAINKSVLSADEIWFCGDSVECDVCGAHNVGMIPVLYCGDTPDDPNPFANPEAEKNIDFEYLKFEDWREMMELIETLRE